MRSRTALTVDGRPAATIVWWGTSASPITPFAASEIQAYLRKMSGATLPIREGVVDAPARLNGCSSAVIIVPDAATGPCGEATTQPAVALPGEWLAPVAHRLGSLPGDGFAIRTTGERIVLAGTEERGTLYAAYRFLEHLGARFFAPAFPFYGEWAEHLPSAASIEVSALDIQEAASFTYRRKYVEEGWSHTPRTLPRLLDWMAKRRLNVLVYPYDYEGLGVVAWDSWRERLIPELAKRGIVLQVGGHGYQSFLPPSRYQSAHPDWFPPDGNVFDVANDDALRTYVANVIAYLRARPEIGIFDAWPPDGARWPASVVERFGSISNAQAHLTRQLSASVRRALPGVQIEALAYVPATEPPDPEQMYDDATIVDVAPYDRSYAEPIFGMGAPKNRYYDQLLARWRCSGFQGDLGIYEYYRKYSWHSLPVLLPRLIGKELPYFRSRGANGLGTYSEPADWITYEFTHELVAALSWNADLRADDYVDAYLAERFGAAAGAMGTYLDLVEEAGRLLFDRPEGNYESLDVVTRVRANYRRAKQVVAAARENVEPRGAPAFLIERLGWNLDFAIADTEVDYHRLRGEPEKMEEARRRARTLADAHRLDGIILQCAALVRRYDAGATRENLRPIYGMYRDAWPWVAEDVRDHRTHPARARQ